MFLSYAPLTYFFFVGKSGSFFFQASRFSTTGNNSINQSIYPSLGSNVFEPPLWPRIFPLHYAPCNEMLPDSGLLNIFRGISSLFFLFVAVCLAMFFRCVSRTVHSTPSIRWGIIIVRLVDGARRNFNPFVASLDVHSSESA